MLKASGDELRVEVLRVLQRDSFGVLELSQIFDIKQSGMSHHLKVLAKAGWVTTRKEGNSVFYQRANQPLLPYNAMAASIFNEMDKIPIRQELQENINKVFEQRAATSLEFFNENANPVKDQQDLIAGLDVYGERVLEMMRLGNPSDTGTANNTNQAFAKYHHILEVGPGTGEFLPALCNLAEHVTGLDNSEKMLNLARQHAEQNAISNIQFCLGDTTECTQLDSAYDCAVINMVLHHTPSPQKIFNDVSQGLSPNGKVIVCDLCQHNQDWARSTCGDMWLGFAPEDLSQWAKEAGLSEGQSSYFALRNGFQIQIRTFVKH